VTPVNCPFCDRIAAGELLINRRLAVAIADAYPLTPGHSLVIPRRHEADFFALARVERAAMLDLIIELHARLKRSHGFDGVNIGLNNGAAAGQVVPHAHLHLIPRYKNDTPDPRGGVRWIFPDRAAYWSSSGDPP
jgi:diadenosine tetraphosphate (Ap4A) HIT family hydrolase